MSRCIYSKFNYRIIKLANNSFMVVNIDKKFEKGHCHTFTYQLAKIIVNTCIDGEFKKVRYDKRMLESILRVCSNKYTKKFQDKLDQLIKNKLENT